jgi:peptidoglycan biosynthesis protein MviN/MurJ (putative lipid II flippase)
MGIKIASLFLIFSIIIITVWGIYMIHEYPGKVAKSRKHPQLRAIQVTSVMGLLFFPLWIFALIWAHSNAIVGKLYNQGDFNENDEEQIAPEPSIVSSKPKVKIESKPTTENKD